MSLPCKQQLGSSMLPRQHVMPATRSAQAHWHRFRCQPASPPTCVMGDCSICCIMSACVAPAPAPPAPLSPNCSIRMASAMGSDAAPLPVAAAACAGPAAPAVLHRQVAASGSASTAGWLLEERKHAGLGRLGRRTRRQRSAAAWT